MRVKAVPEAMETLTIEPTYRVLLGDVDHFRILIAGVGGTGSSLALFLAGLAFHARQKGIQVEMTLVDDDVVEMRNCGRQALSVQAASAGGVPKAADLALRLNAAYGLDIAARPEKYTPALGSRWLRSAGGRRCVHLIIGCVDNYLGRRAIAETVAAGDGRLWAIDCGNERTSGQVLVGNLSAAQQPGFDRLGLCSGLPSPYLQEPDLLTPDPAADAPSCAERAWTEAQSLMINRLAAVTAAEMVTEMVLGRQVSRLGADFSLSPLAMRPRLVTETAVRACFQ